MPSTTDAPARREDQRPRGRGRHGKGIKTPRRAARRAGSSANGVRYFVGRPASGDGKPTLEQEVASEPEALVIAFKNDSRVYFVNEFRVTQRIEGGQVRLEKEPAAAAQTGFYHQRKLSRRRPRLTWELASRP